MVAVLTPTDGGKPIVVDKAVILVGRHPDCDYILQASRKVSRRHLCVVQVNDQYLVRDLGSMNGIWINGQRVEREHPITIGDELSIGDLVFRFEMVQKLPRAARTKPRPAATPDADPVPGATPPGDLDLSQANPVAIPDEEDSFQVLDDAAGVRSVVDGEPELKPVVDPPPENASLDEFVPVVDVDATFDEDEVDDVIILDDDADELGEDDIILLD